MVASRFLARARARSLLVPGISASLSPAFSLLKECCAAVLDEHRSGTKGPNRTASKLMFLTCVRFRTKAPISEFPGFRSAAALPWNPAADPTVPGRKAARVGPPLLYR